MSRARSIAAIASLPQSSFCSGTGTGRSRRNSVATDSSLLDEFSPLGVVVADEAGKVRGGVGDQLNALLPETRLELRAAQDLHHFVMHAGDDIGRHLGRHEQPQPRME